MRSVVILSLALLLVTSTAHAQDEAPGEFSRFHAAGFFGESHNGDRNGITFGGDLEVRATRLFGLGVTGEHVNEPFRENVWVVPVLVHPSRRLKLTVGPGFERAREDAEGAEFRTHALLRLGATWEFPLRHGWSIDPDLALDLVEHQRVLVYTVAISREFGPRVKARDAH